MVLGGLYGTCMRWDSVALCLRGYEIRDLSSTRKTLCGSQVVVLAHGLVTSVSVLFAFASVRNRAPSVRVFRLSHSTELVRRR